MRCTTFQNQFGEMKQSFSELGDHIAEYMEDPQTMLQRYPDYYQRITGLMSSQEKFLDDYKTAVMDMLNKWNMSMFKNQQDVPDVEFDEEGRVTFNSWIALTRDNVLPTIIKNCRDITLTESNITNIDYLEKARNIRAKDSKPISFGRLREVTGDLEFESTKVKSLTSLKKVRGQFKANEGLESAPELEEVGWAMQIYRGVNNFRQVFPKLRRVGMVTDGRRTHSFIVQRHLKKQIEQLKEAGELEYEGEVIIRPLIQI